MIDQKPSRATPTDKMLSFARKMSKDIGVPMPPEAETSFDACRDYLDAHADQVAPTEGQIQYATRLAEAAGEPIPEDAMASRKKLSSWIDEMAGT